MKKTQVLQEIRQMRFKEMYEKRAHKRFTVEHVDLSPRNRTMTKMRFPVTLSKRESQHEEETFYRSTNYWVAQRA